MIDVAIRNDQDIIKLRVPEDASIARLKALYQDCEGFPGQRGYVRLVLGNQLLGDSRCVRRVT